MSLPSYPGEPEPLKVGYPERMGPIQTLMMAIGAFLLLASIAWFTMPGGSRPPMPWWSPILILVCLVAEALLLVWLTGEVGEWERERRWRRAFLANNDDLGLSAPAIKSTVNFLRGTTEYTTVEFATVARAVAMSFRDEHGTLEKTDLTNRAVAAYRIFASREKYSPPRMPSQQT